MVEWTIYSLQHFHCLVFRPPLQPLTKTFCAFQLFSDCHLVNRVLGAWDENEKEELEPGFKRKGYMGHLTRIANVMVSQTVIQLLLMPAKYRIISWSIQAKSVVQWGSEIRPFEIWDLNNQLQWGSENQTCPVFEWSTLSGFRMASGFRMVPLA